MRFKDKMAEVYETDIPNNFFPLAIEKYSSGESERLGIDPSGYNGADRAPAKWTYLLYQA
jgi:hypothetical protein